MLKIEYQSHAFDHYANLLNSILHLHIEISLFHFFYLKITDLSNDNPPTQIQK